MEEIIMKMLYNGNMIKIAKIGLVVSIIAFASLLFIRLGLLTPFISDDYIGRGDFSTPMLFGISLYSIAKLFQIIGVLGGVLALMGIKSIRWAGIAILILHFLEFVNYFDINIRGMFLG